MQGVRARQHDAWDIGVMTSDNFGNADVLYPETLPAVQKALTWSPDTQPYIPVVTGFLGRGQMTGAVADYLELVWYLSAQGSSTLWLLLVAYLTSGWDVDCR